MKTPPKLTVERLDKLAEILEEDPVSKLALIFGMLKIILALAYLWSRRKLIDEQELWLKQQGEIDKDKAIEDELRQEGFDNQ